MVYIPGTLTYSKHCQIIILTITTANIYSPLTTCQALLQHIAYVIVMNAPNTQNGHRYHPQFRDRGLRYSEVN